MPRSPCASLLLPMQLVPCLQLCSHQLVLLGDTNVELETLCFVNTGDVTRNSINRVTKTSYKHLRGSFIDDLSSGLRNAYVTTTACIEGPFVTSIAQNSHSLVMHSVGRGTNFIYCQIVEQNINAHMTSGVDPCVICCSSTPWR